MNFPGKTQWLCWKWNISIQGWVYWVFFFLSLAAAYWRALCSQQAGFSPNEIPESMIMRSADAEWKTLLLYELACNAALEVCKKITLSTHTKCEWWLWTPNYPFAMKCLFCVFLQKSACSSKQNFNSKVLMSKVWAKFAGGIMIGFYWLRAWRESRGTLNFLFALSGSFLAQIMPPWGGFYLGIQQVAPALKLAPQAPTRCESHTPDWLGWFPVPCDNLCVRTKL